MTDRLESPNEQPLPVVTPSQWKNLCDAARAEGTKFSTSATQRITPAALLGTYCMVWESNTDMGGYDSLTQEVSYLDLALEKSALAAKKFKDAAQARKLKRADAAKFKLLEARIKAFQNSKKDDADEESSESETTDESDNEQDIKPALGSAKREGVNVKPVDEKSVKKEDSVEHAPAPEVDVDFMNVWGRFRWWRMVGQFRGLYRPAGAPENMWYFGNVTWSPLGADPDDSDEEEADMCDDDDADGSSRDTDDFGLAALITADDKGRPFLEMLYNGTKYFSRFRALGVAAGTDALLGVNERVYVRILWKKQEKDWNRRPLEISFKERRRLRRDEAVATLEDYGDASASNSENDNEEETKVGSKRVADVDDGGLTGAIAGEEKAMKRAKTGH